MKIDPGAEGLDGGDDPGRKRAPGHNLEVTAQGPEGRAAELPEETLSISKKSGNLGKRNSATISFLLPGDVYKKA